MLSRLVTSGYLEYKNPFEPQLAAYGSKLTDKTKNMKTKILRLITILLLLLPVCMVLLGAGCEKDQEEYSDYVEGYIVGSFQCNNDSKERGFCIILENNADSVFTFSLPEDIFDFPQGIIKPGHDAFSGGPYFFPDSLRYEFKLKFKSKKPDKSEVIDCPLAFNTMGIPFSWEKWNYVILENVSKPSK